MGGEEFRGEFQGAISITTTTHGIGYFHEPRAPHISSRQQPEHQYPVLIALCCAQIATHYHHHHGQTASTEPPSSSHWNNGNNDCSVSVAAMCQYSERCGGLRAERSPAVYPLHSVLVPALDGGAGGGGFVGFAVLSDQENG